MTNKIKEKQLNEVLYGLDYIGNKIKNDDGKLELGVNNCKLLLDYINDLKQRKDTALNYIYLNFSNEDGSIWHQDFKIIKDILRGDNK